ncbi:MAG TPA: hypothetical protein VEW48_09180 [Thermoanaerobaculia bacterium]|nr:hypothetical protein [Thermoanaerobaculia bacterium]
MPRRDHWRGERSLPAASGAVLAIGIDPGIPRAKAAAACSVLTIEPRDEGPTIGIAGRSEALKKADLAAFLRDDPLLADERLRLAAINGPLTPVRLERKPLRARQVEIRLSRGSFAGSSRGPHPLWISAGRSGWLRYLEAATLQDILAGRGLPLLAMPPEGVALELPARCCAEVFTKGTLTVLVPPDSLENRPMVGEFLGQIDDWLFPQLFLRRSPGEPAPVERILEKLAPGLRLAPETLLEAERITRIRRPYSRREPLRAFVAAFQGVLALAGAAALVGAEGDTEGYYLMPAAWHPGWEKEWSDPMRQEPRVLRVRIPSPREP